jgi:chromosome segregation ATPase
MKRVSMIFGAILFVALAGIVIQREVALSGRVGALSDRVTQLEAEKSDLLSQVSELGYDLNGVTSKLESEIQERENLKADLIDWTDKANELFGVLVNDPTTPNSTDLANLQFEIDNLKACINAGLPAC